MRWLRPALGLWALAEVIVFVLVAGQIGIGWTILLTLATSALGWMMLARQGMRAIRELQERARTRQPAGKALGDAGMAGVGGLLMVLPGFIGDLLGLMCLLPGTRTVIRALIGRVFAARVLAHLPDRVRGRCQVSSTRTGMVDAPAPAGASGSHRASPTVIEGEIAG